MNKSTNKASDEASKVKLTHYKGLTSERVFYTEPAHFRTFGKSVTDKSMFVPLSVQVAEMLGKVEKGLGQSSSVAIHSDKDYTFPDGKTGVDSWKPSPLDDRGLDIAEISEFKRILESELSALNDQVVSSSQKSLIEKSLAQIKASQALDADKLKELGSFGDLIEKYNTSLLSNND